MKKAPLHGGAFVLFYLLQQCTEGIDCTDAHQSRSGGDDGLLRFAGGLAGSSV